MKWLMFEMMMFENGFRKKSTTQPLRIISSRICHRLVLLVQKKKKRRRGSKEEEEAEKMKKVLNAKDPNSLSMKFLLEK